jgi:LemA protein
MQPTIKSFFTLPVILLGIALIIGLWFMSSYNGLVTGKELIATQRAQVEVQQQRRFDLIPNLVDSVKGVMKQETAIFTALAEARTRYSGATTPADRSIASGQVESALGRLLVITENYPQLKSAENVQSLMAELAGTENRISVERMRFNETVRDYNLQVKRVPGSLFASLFGFIAEIPYTADAGATKAPTVNF